MIFLHNKKHPREAPPFMGFLLSPDFNTRGAEKAPRSLGGLKTPFTSF